MRIRDGSSDVCSADLIGRTAGWRAALVAGTGEGDRLIEGIERIFEADCTERQRQDVTGLVRQQTHVAAQCMQALIVVQAVVEVEQHVAKALCQQHVGFRQRPWCDRQCVRRREPEVSSEEHTSELQSLMRISYAVFCLNKKHMSPTQT